MKKLTIRFLVVSACLTVMAGVPAMAKGKQEMENPWVKPGTTPPLVPGTGMTVSCPDPLPQGTGKGVKLENQKEAFHIRLPANFDPRETYGVVVFISGPQKKDARAPHSGPTPGIEWDECDGVMHRTI